MVTLSLCLIAKNEAHNLPILYESIEGCFDEIILVDTGSTDDTVKSAQERGMKVYHFPWVNDFSAARNFSFEKATCDYVGWLDCDDSLSNKENFIEWKKYVMPLANYHLATYHYASNSEGKPVCSFARERVIKRTANFRWKYFVHEGVVPIGNEPVSTAGASSWAVIHRRTQADLLADKGRNLRLFEANIDNLDARMTYYYGKELFENGKPLEGYPKLMEAAKNPELDHYDRILALQFAATAACQLKQYAEAIDIAIRGLQLAPTRAEFFVIIADSYVAQGRLAESVPYYAAATKCRLEAQKAIFAPPIFSAEVAYTHWPRLQLGRIFFQMGDIERSKACLNDAKQFGSNPDIDAAEKEVLRIEKKIYFPPIHLGVHTDDIVISAPPGTGFYEWDDDVYKTYGCGGSETAAIEIAQHMAQQTGRKVLVYNDRKVEKTFGNVHYRQAETLPDYFNEHIPAWHLQWRHALRITNAKSTAWLHDLAAMGIEHNQLDSVFALSEFHKQYLTHLFSVDPSKIIVTRNGVDPYRWSAADFTKKENIVVFPSSPDRGLARALRVMDLVAKEVPDVQFKAYYGFENMVKAGKMKEVQDLQQMFNERPWAVMVGNVNQTKLTQELLKAKVWLYPTNFFETFAISALECAISKVYPVVRKWGALPNTLDGIPSDIIDRDCQTIGDYEYWAERTVAALREEKWKELRVSALKYSWASVSQEWVKLMDL